MQSVRSEDPKPYCGEVVSDRYDWSLLLTLALGAIAWTVVLSLLVTCIWKV
jgi:hypothetical protein